MGNEMIKEEKKELIDRREFYQMMIQRMNQQDGATLNSTLTLREIVEIFRELPTYDELGAEWVYDNIEESHVCSWCRMIGNSYARYCSYCGRRMRRKDNDGSKM